MTCPRRRLLWTSLLLALMVCLIVLDMAEGIRIKQRMGKKPSGPFIFGSLPESPPATSNRYKRFLKLTRLGYEGGAVERALSAEQEDVDRAALRLARDYSGFHGMHCLTKGACFGDPRQAVFKVPTATTVPERPPAFQAPPPVENEAEAAAQKAADLKSGVDLSYEILHRQKFKEDVVPRLDPFARVSPKPKEVPHNREHAPVRGSSLGTTEQQDKFTSLMRSWLTTINSPFHTKKPGSTHESDIEHPSLPADTHPAIVPVKMKYVNGGKEVRVDWRQPVQYVTTTPKDLAAVDARRTMLDENRKAAQTRVILDRIERTEPASNAAAPASASALTAAQQQDLELSQTNGDA